LADKVREELGAGVALVNLVFSKNLVGEVGAGFEGELFRQDEGVVTVEEEFSNLGT
jgi:hypothetical protein